MRIFDLTERNQQKTMIMYHGTSSTNLRSILKHGLLADPPKRTYDGSFGPDGYDTYGGIYLTPRRKMAKDAAYSSIDSRENNGDGSMPDAIIVTVQMVLGSGSLDEDLITFPLITSIIIFFTDIKDSLGDDPDYIEYYDTHDDLIRQHIIAPLMKKFSNMGKVGHVVENAIKKALDEIFDAVTTDDIIYNDIMEVMGGNIEFIDQIQTIMDNLFPARPQNTQINRDIGFRGKTRIIEIENITNNTIIYKEDY